MVKGSRRFGMLARSGRGRSPASYGTEVEIVECEPLPGGRYYMEVVGRRGKSRRCSCLKL